MRRVQGLQQRAGLQVGFHFQCCCCSAEKSDLFERTQIPKKSRESQRCGYHASPHPLRGEFKFCREMQSRLQMLGGFFQCLFPKHYRSFHHGEITLGRGAPCSAPFPSPPCAIAIIFRNRKITITAQSPTAASGKAGTRDFV